MLAKVNFNLINVDSNAGQMFYFNTEDDSLKMGDVVLVKTRGELRFANFVTYSEAKYTATSDLVGKATVSELKTYYSIVKDILLSKPLKLNENAYKAYVSKFKDTEHATLEEAQKKLTRNAILAMQYDGRKLSDKGYAVMYYGMQEIVVRNNEIISVKPTTQKRKFKKSKVEYIALNKHFGLE